MTEGCEGNEQQHGLNVSVCCDRILLNRSLEQLLVFKVVLLSRVQTQRDECRRRVEARQEIISSETQLTSKMNYGSFSGACCSCQTMFWFVDEFVEGGCQRKWRTCDVLMYLKNLDK